MTDDYKDEYLPRLQKSKLFLTLQARCVEKDSAVVTLVESGVEYAFQRTKTIIRHMGEFTLHDGDHLFRVLNTMEKLIPEKVLSNLSTPELMLLILAAFFHDIGMAPDEKQVLTWRKFWDMNPDVAPDIIREFEEFKRFMSARPHHQEVITKLRSQGKDTEIETIKSYYVTEYIRESHASRAREIIERDWDGKIRYRDTDLTVEFAQICFSHNEDALTLLELDKSYLCAENTYACLPFIGVILRLSDILDFDAKRTPTILFSHLYVRDPISLTEWRKHRSVEAREVTPEFIQFNAQCTHPAIEASIHKFCDLIDHELSICNNVCSVLNEYNISRKREIEIKFPFKVNRDKIVTKKNISNNPIYIYRDTKFNLSKSQVIDLLMGTKLYGNPEVALRELLQNSIDACLLRQAQEVKWGNPFYKPEIFVRYFKEEEEYVLEVEDNGTGMDQYIIDKFYSNVGSSFYRSTDFFTLKAESNADFTPTSRFGIGILSCFMVADTLIVDTKRVYAKHTSSSALNVTVEGQESIFWIRDGKRELPGTTTRLILRRSRNPWERMKEDEFVKSVQSVLPNPPFKINIVTETEISTIDENSFRLIRAGSIKGNSWGDNENIKIIEVELDTEEKGIVGSALVAILESRGEPTEIVNLNSLVELGIYAIISL
jgi:molecular chaperone HtpG